MSGKKSAEPSPQSIARTNRQRLAAEEGTRAMADVERQAVDVRKNMARLRERREAHAQADATHQPKRRAPTQTNRKRKLTRESE